MFKVNSNTKCAFMLCTGIHTVLVESLYKNNTAFSAREQNDSKLLVIFTGCDSVWTAFLCCFCPYWIRVGLKLKSFKFLKTFPSLKSLWCVVWKRNISQVSIIIKLTGTHFGLTFLHLQIFTYFHIFMFLSYLIWFCCILLLLLFLIVFYLFFSFFIICCKAL